MTIKLLLTILKLALTCVLIVPGIVSAQSPTPSSGKRPNIARWIHDFDVSKRVEGNAFNFSASLKF